MTILILLFGVLAVVMGLIGFVSPSTLMRLVSGMKSRSMFMVAVLLRLGFGAVMILGAAMTRFPLTIRILGVITVLGGAGLLLAGPARFQKLIDWWAAQPGWVARAWVLLAVVFGAFLIYAAY